MDSPTTSHRLLEILGTIEEGTLSLMGILRKLTVV
jgi:hypothetical protein